ncbi:hypothetical protein NW762_007400 [Fusarium torreyae]|uniref:Fungal N-terminal domain-containing protein n=1 Tax=Fusarium torreyae TaxID=1237075 RepID=A0A9W8RY57_9HYPO|nr:hypothetical protein NW762_007400 [Fusarium torreyae]
MAEIGFAASVLTLINAALFTVKEIQKVHHRVSGTSASLDNISKQLNTLERSLSLIRNETSLQNQDGIEQQIQSVINLSTELKGFHDHLSLVYQRSSTSQFVHALRSGSREERYLEGILKRLDTANNDLTMRILIAQVGVVRYFQGGFRVAYNVLEQINARVKQVLGMNLALLELVRNREQWFGQ